MSLRGGITFRHWALVTVIPLLMTGFLAGCAGSSSPETLVEYRRSGGFVGFDDHLVINKDGTTTLTRHTTVSEFTLDQNSIDRLNALFEEAAFSELRRRYVPPRAGNDLFEYEVTYSGKTVRAVDGAAPPSLTIVLDTLNRIVDNPDNL